MMFRKDTVFDNDNELPEPSNLERAVFAVRKTPRARTVWVLTFKTSQDAQDNLAVEYFDTREGAQRAAARAATRTDHYLDVVSNDPVKWYAAELARSRIASDPLLLLRIWSEVYTVGKDSSVFSSPGAYFRIDQLDVLQ